MQQEVSSSCPVLNAFLVVLLSCCPVYIRKAESIGHHSIVGVVGGLVIEEECFKTDG